MQTDCNRQHSQIISGAAHTKTAIETSGDEFRNVAFENFDYDAIDEANGWHDPDERKEHNVSMSDMGAALSLTIQWICSAENMKSSGARAHTLLTYLDPVNSRYSSLAAIAKEAGITRATISKALLELRDGAGINLTMGKLGGTRQTYSDAQREAVAKGTHCSRTRKDSVQ